MKSTKNPRTKGKDCFQDNWVRYEMRYRHDKAYDVCMNLLNGDNELFKKMSMDYYIQCLILKQIIIMVKILFTNHEAIYKQFTNRNGNDKSRKYIWSKSILIN